MSYGCCVPQENSHHLGEVLPHKVQDLDHQRKQQTSLHQGTLGKMDSANAHVATRHKNRQSRPRLEDIKEKELRNIPN